VSIRISFVYVKRPIAGQSPLRRTRVFHYGTLTGLRAHRRLSPPIVIAVPKRGINCPAAGGIRGQAAIYRKRSILIGRPTRVHVGPVRHVFVTPRPRPWPPTIVAGYMRTSASTPQVRERHRGRWLRSRLRTHDQRRGPERVGPRPRCGQPGHCWPGGDETERPATINDESAFAHPTLWSHRTTRTFTNLRNGYRWWPAGLSDHDKKRRPSEFRLHTAFRSERGILAQTAGPMKLVPASTLAPPTQGAGLGAGSSNGRRSWEPPGSGG